MYIKLKRLSLKKSLPVCGVSLLIGALLLILALPSLLTLSGGAASLSEVPADKLDGAYVEADLNQIVGNFAQSVVSSDDSEEVVSTYYVISYGEDNYLSLMIQGDKYASELESIQDAVSAYYSGEADAITASYTIKGTVSPLDSVNMEYFRDWFSETGFVENADEAYLNEHVLAFVIKEGRAGGFSPAMDWILSLLGLVLFALGVTAVLVILSGRFQAPVKALQAGLSRREAETLESDFQGAKRIGNAYVGRLFTWYFTGIKTEIMKNSEIVWLHATFKKLEKDKRKWSLVCRLRDRSSHTLKVRDENQLQALVEAIEAAGFPVVTGYSREKEALFNSDMDAFIHLGDAEDDAPQSTAPDEL